MVFGIFLKKSSYQGIRDMGINRKSVKFSTKKVCVNFSPFWAIQWQIAFEKSKNRFFMVFGIFLKKSSYQSIRDMGIKRKSVKLSAKKVCMNFSPFWAIQWQIAFEKSKKPIFDSFLHFSKEIVKSRYKRHRYQMKERKILYKKV